MYGSNQDWTKVSDADLVDFLISAASLNNECDNREAVHDARVEVLRRLRVGKKD